MPITVAVASFAFSSAARAEAKKDLVAFSPKVRR
jgi:hypothetical protein